jgi:hypothetical protein
MILARPGRPRQPAIPTHRPGGRAPAGQRLRYHFAQEQPSLRVAIVAAALCLVPSFATPKSLGDAARLAAKKRGETPAARSYSDDDLRAGAASAAETPPPASAAEQVTPAGKPTPEAALRTQLDREEKERKEQEERWRALAREARTQIERAQGELDDCRLRGG